MEKLHFKGSIKTPDIVLDSAKGIISIKGRSLHENATDFFAPLEKWINEYCLHPAAKTTVTFALDYFNSSSFRAFRKIIQVLDIIAGDPDKELQVNWFYEVGDVNARESGELLSEQLSIPFHFVELDE
ncbi:MAG: DUF1987 domain-containing protein [Flavobacteriales bacterium]